MRGEDDAWIVPWGACAERAPVDYGFAVCGQLFERPVAVWAAACGVFNGTAFANAIAVGDTAASTSAGQAELGLFSFEFDGR